MPLEIAICESAARLRERGTTEFYGYDIARRLAKANDAKLLPAYGTLYRALGRLENMGMLKSRWEESDTPARESRPARRLYTLTALGEAAWREAAKSAPARSSRRRLASA